VPRCWLVERGYDDRGLVRLTYATPDGERMRRRELSRSLLARRDAAPTAAVDVEEDDLVPVPDGDRDRYAAEADRMAAEHDPGDEV